MAKSTIALTTGELLVMEPDDTLWGEDGLVMQPIYEIAVDYDGYKKLKERLKKCSVCHKDLEDWEINVNIGNHSRPSNQNKRGNIRRRCYRCACNEM